MENSKFASVNRGEGFTRPMPSPETEARFEKLPDDIKEKIREYRRQALYDITQYFPSSYDKTAAVEETDSGEKIRLSHRDILPVPITQERMKEICIAGFNSIVYEKTQEGRFFNGESGVFIGLKINPLDGGLTNEVVIVRDYKAFDNDAEFRSAWSEAYKSGNLDEARRQHQILMESDRFNCRNNHDYRSFYGRVNLSLSDSKPPVPVYMLFGISGTDPVYDYLIDMPEEHLLTIQRLASRREEDLFKNIPGEFMDALDEFAKKYITKSFLRYLRSEGYSMKKLTGDSFYSYHYPPEYYTDAMSLSRKLDDICFRFRDDKNVHHDLCELRGAFLIWNKEKRDRVIDYISTRFFGWASIKLLDKIIVPVMTKDELIRIHPGEDRKNWKPYEEFLKEYILKLPSPQDAPEKKQFDPQVLRVVSSPRFNAEQGYFIVQCEGMYSIDRINLIAFSPDLNDEQFLDGFLKTVSSGAFVSVSGDCYEMPRDGQLAKEGESTYVLGESSLTFTKSFPAQYLTFELDPKTDQYLPERVPAAGMKQAVRPPSGERPSFKNIREYVKQRDNDAAIRLPEDTGLELGDEENPPAPFRASRDIIDSEEPGMVVNSLRLGI